MVSIRETLQKAHEALEKIGVDHALIGGMALGGLGIHRATMDVDLLIDGEKSTLAKAELEKTGFQLVAETKEVLHFSGVGQLDLLLAHRSPTQLMLKNANILKPLGIKCLQAEDIIGLKIQAYINDEKRSLQDKADIAKLIQTQKTLDWAKIKRYADLFNEWPTIEALKKQYEL